MEGHGKVVDEFDPNVKGTLDFLIRTDPSSRFAGWRANGRWVSRDGVWVVGNSPNTPWPRVLPLTPGQHGAYAGTIGPELSIGSALGDHYGGYDPVVLVKVAVGGTSLRTNFRPPSAGGTTGELYATMVDEINAVMAGVGNSTALPSLRGLPSVLEGLFWFQGWNDLSDPDGYGELLGSLIADVRAAVGEPQLPAIIGATGNGYEGARQTLVGEQQAAAERTLHAGFVPTRQYLRDESDSPGGGLHHWHGNAESYLEIGEAMGQKMLEVMGAARP